MTDLPVLEDDLFADAALADPYLLYRTLRDVGPVVYLAAQGMPAIGRYADVRAVLADHDTFVSGQGVAWNDAVNEMSRGATLTTDPPEHAQLRRLLAHRLTPRALRDQRAGIAAKARDVVVAVLARGDVVDAVADIAVPMPMSVVPDFLGFPEDCRPKLVGWAQATIDAAGPVGERTPRVVPVAIELGRYAAEVVATRAALPGSLGADLLAAADRGEISMERCIAMLLDYFAPALETTLSAIGSALALFSRHPEQWDLLRVDPSLAAGAFNEAVRLESPLRGFTRVAARDTEISGSPIAAGTRVGGFLASANRDERKWDRADTFDIRRDNADHLALGYGEHGCAGQGLARLEVTALLTSLAESVARIEPAGDPTVTVNSIARSYSAVPVRLVPAAQEQR